MAKKQLIFNPLLEGPPKNIFEYILTFGKSRPFTILYGRETFAEMLSLVAYYLVLYFIENILFFALCSISFNEEFTSAFVYRYRIISDPKFIKLGIARC